MLYCAQRDAMMARESVGGAPQVGMRAAWRDRPPAPKRAGLLGTRGTQRADTTDCGPRLMTASMLRVRRDDYTAASSWRLLDWCMTRGADEFTLGFLGPPYVSGTTWAELDELLAPFRRRVASAGDRGMLTGESAAVLKDMLPNGLLGSASAGGPAAIRDPAVYRGGTLMLAIESDAGVGTLSLKDDDEASLARTGLPVHRGGTAR